MVYASTISHLKNFCCNAWTFFLESCSWITQTLSQITCVVSHATTYSTYFLLSVWHIRLSFDCHTFSNLLELLQQLLVQPHFSQQCPTILFPWKLHAFETYIDGFSFHYNVLLPNSLLREFAMINTYQQNICKLMNKLMNERNLLKDLWAHNLKALIISKQTCAWLCTNK
jgi:hypothetical protein